MAFDGSEVAGRGTSRTLGGPRDPQSGPRPERVCRSDAAPIAPLDLQHLARYTLGDRALEAEILALFIGEVPKTLAALRAADDVSDWKRAAHTLKGSGRAVGAWRIAQIAESAERLCDTEADTPAARDDVLARLADAADEAARFITSLSQGS